ncbi:unnamed protein product [Hydatigera taeniaeformis]|uniref:Disintegrin domain-containing protein n=1 Tax=Hydatigena taeniaeformis TaxID=6205 RepID=A0A0R3WYX6_HYDTA|nr:unnamed protein product [Hydatigera taeniaeformis]
MVLLTAVMLLLNKSSMHGPWNSVCLLTSALRVDLFLSYLQRFSPCSRRAIGRCLASRAVLCFEEEPFARLPLSQCGNSRVDPGEECDPGWRVGGAQKADPCCTSLCRLKPGAKCSPLNHQCCTLGRAKSL